MPANLTPQYKDAERRFRQATSPQEQEKALGEMLAQIPKHKGTEKLQADIKRRLAQLRKEKAKPSAVSRQRPIYVIDIEGAGQVPVLGAPNSGKSALIAAISNAHVQVADYPYTTQQPMPAMMPFENTQVQLIDTPPASSEFAPPWLGELVRRADAVVLVADLSVPDCWEGPAFILEQLEESGIQLVGARIDRIGEGGDRSLIEGSSNGEERRGGEGNGHVEGGAADPNDDGGGDDDESLTFRVPAILVGTKSDMNQAPQRIDELLAYFGDRFPIVAVSIEDSESLQRFRRVAFEALHVVRVYSKEPGKAAERSKPWLLQEGSTVHDLANAIHHELATGFRYGRLWGSSRFEGQRVGEDYVLRDEDIVEIHTR